MCSLLHLFVIETSLAKVVTETNTNTRLAKKRGTHSTPTTLHCLQHFTACLIQNSRLGLNRSNPRLLDPPKKFSKLVFGNYQGDNVLVFGGLVPVYEDLFGKYVKKIIKIGLILSQNFSGRKQLLNKTAKQSTWTYSICCVLQYVYCTDWNCCIFLLWESSKSQMATSRPQNGQFGLKRDVPRFLGGPINFCSISFLIWGAILIE